MPMSLSCPCIMLDVIERLVEVFSLRSFLSNGYLMLTMVKNARTTNTLHTLGSLYETQCRVAICDVEWPYVM